MQDVITQLNRNTTLRANGIATDSSAMNLFAELVFTSLELKSVDAQYNMIENMLCCEGLSEEIRQKYEAKRTEISRKQSLENLSRAQISLSSQEEMGAIKR